MRNADELSTTVAPARTAMGAKRFEVLPPAENSAMSTPLKLCSFNSRTGRLWPRNASILPAERAEANSRDRKSTRLNSSHSQISYAVFCLKKKKTNHPSFPIRNSPQYTSSQTLYRTTSPTQRYPSKLCRSTTRTSLLPSHTQNRQTAVADS